ncbi:MAG: hypothetical protein K5866_08460 [Treponema sp.]|nr:hypothetical protein [Treponema sp.]
MDDKEYYSLMNRSSSWALQEALKKSQKEKNNKSRKEGTYSNLEARQGRADAEMLMEKKNLTFNDDSQS